MNPDWSSLRNRLSREAMGAAFGGGFGGALIDAEELEDASPEELLEMAERYEGYDAD